MREMVDQLRAFAEEHVLYPARPGSKELPLAAPSGSAAIPSQLLEDLKRDGMLVFPGYLRPAILERILIATTEAYLGRRSDISVSDSVESAYRYIDNPLRLSPDIFSLAFDPFLVGLIEAYFQCDVFLAEADMRRVLPVSMEEFARLSTKNAQGYSPSHWHYDMRGRQMKIMVYLTDVSEGDQNFAFCPCTHQMRPDVPRSRTDYAKSRFPEGWPETHGYPVVECYGKAGTVMMFDTNGIHRLRRTKQSQRNSFTFYYTPGQALRPLDYDHEQAALIAPGLRRLLGGSRK
jgi:hypothetical protein